jgi:hypothetical protein
MELNGQGLTAEEQQEIDCLDHDIRESARRFEDMIASYNNRLALGLREYEAGMLRRDAREISVSIHEMIRRVATLQERGRRRDEKRELDKKRELEKKRQQHDSKVSAP